MTRTDRFITPYMGKDYSGTACEPASLGFENISTEQEAGHGELDFMTAGIVIGR